MSDLEIKPGMVIPARELQFAYSRSGGPGGQNVNKVETRVQLRFDLEASLVFNAGQKRRIAEAAGRRMTSEGQLLMSCDSYRERERNRAELLARFRRLVLSAIAPKKARKATKPTQGSKRRRLEGKKRRSAIKSSRRRPGADD